MKDTNTPRETRLSNIPELVDHYEVETEIGSGTFGVVYRARQRSTGQIVAVKMLNAASLSAQHSSHYLQRFKREMRLTAQITHPHVVRLLDSGGSAESKSLFAVFEYIDGTTLAEIFAKGDALTTEEAHRIALQLFDGLTAAHKLGIVHRDLKPSNVMVSRSGALVNAHILDFGLGAFFDDLQTAQTARITLSHEMLGTPAYSSPEQIRGETLTAKSDYYSWAMIVAECLGGQPLIPNTTVNEILALQLSPNNLPLPTSILNRPIAGVLQNLLNKNPAGRSARKDAIINALSHPHDARGLVRASDSDLDFSLTTFACARITQNRSVDTKLDASGLATTYRGQLFATIGEYQLYGFGVSVGDPLNHARACLFAIEIMQHDVASSVGISYGELPSRTTYGELTSSPLADRALSNAMMQSNVIRVPVTLRDTFEQLVHPEQVEISEDDTLIVSVDTRRRLPTRTTDTSSSPIIGRHAEQEIVLRSIDRCIEGSGNSILVVGNEGIGKTRLLQEIFIRITSRSLYWMEIANGFGLINPVISFSNATSDMVDTLSGKTLNEIGVPPEDLGGQPAITQPNAQTDLSPTRPALSEEEQVNELVGGIVRFCLNVSEKRPMIVVFEDVHYADDITLQAISELVAICGSYRIQVLLTCQTSRLPEGLPRTGQSLELVPLGKQEVQQIADLDDPLSQSAAGNPRAILALRDSRENKQLSPTVRLAALQQIDAFRDVHDLLAWIAVYGYDTPVSQLAYLTGQRSDEVLGRLSPMFEHALLTRLTLDSTAYVAFTSSLVRDAIVESIESQTLLNMHKAVASALEAHPHEAVKDYNATLAYQLSSAGMVEKAIAMHLAAGKEAKSALLHSKALAQFEAAARLSETLADSQQRNHHLLQSAIQSIPPLGMSRGFGSQSMQQTIDRIATLATNSGDYVQLAKSLHSGSRHLQSVGQITESVKIANKVIKMCDEGELANAPEVNDLVHAAQLSKSFSKSYMTEFHESIALGEANLLLAGRVQDKVMVRENRGWLAWNLFVTGEVERAMNIVLELTNDLHVHDRDPSRFLAMAIHACVRWYLRDFTGARDVARSLNDATSMDHFPYWKNVGRIIFSAAESVTADRNALDPALRGLRDFEASGYRNGITQWIDIIASAAIAVEELDIAADVLRQTDALRTKTEDAMFEASLKLRGLSLCEARGDNERAGELHEYAKRLVEKQDVWLFRLELLVTQLENGLQPTKGMLPLHIPRTTLTIPLVQYLERLTNTQAIDIDDLIA